jgi:arginine exporter protein ArgO
MENSKETNSDRQILIGKLHDSLYDSSRSIGLTDTILVACTYIFNLAMLFIIVISKDKSTIFFVFLITLVIVNILILATFKNSRELREKLHLRQRQIYEDLNLIKYFDDSILQNYKRHYTIWIILDIVLGVMAIVVALLFKFQS